MTAVSSQPVRGSRFPTLEKYDVIEELGHGGMATVYRARDLRLGRDVAVKVIHPHLRDSAEAVRRFSIEARAVAKLRHANIVEVYDVSGPTESEQYLVVELLRGVTLRKLLELHGALPAEVAASICVELLGALGHAHDAGVVHRDVKPENVIIEHRASGTSDCVKQDAPTPTPSPPPPSPSSPPLPSGTFATPATASSSPVPGRTSDGPGDRIRIKLTDFGIAKLLDAQGVTSTGQVLGSPAHMAPEQIEGREVGGRADVFAIGVLLYECMVGHLPFQGSNPAQVLRRVLDGEYPSAEREQPTIGRTWSRIVDQALAADLETRFSSAPQMRDTLMRELTRLGVSSPRGEVEAWLDDPAGFASAHQKAMTATLCAKAVEASRRGDVLVAAADYNRALAYAPHDAALLKIVSRVNRRRARRDIIGRTWPYAALGVLLLGGGAGARSYLARRAQTQAVDASMALPPVAPVIPVSPGAVVVPVSTLPELAASARTIARPAVGPHMPPATARPVLREVRFTSIEPPQGVRVSIDGAPSTAIDGAKSLTIDEKGHVLKFSCPLNLCDTFVRTVDPGDRPVPLAVHLTITPATLVVHGVDGKHYALRSDPQNKLSLERSNPVQMTESSRRVVTVIEIETGRSQSVELRAGESSSVDFAAPVGTPQ